MLEQASVGAFVNLTTDEPERWAADLDGLEQLQLGHLELWLEHLPSHRELALLDSLLGNWPRIMHGPFIGMSLATDWDELGSLSLDRCHRAIEAAALLDCEVVTLHAGPYANFGPHTRALERLAARLSRFARLSFPAVTVENMPARGGATSEAVAATADLDALGELLPELSFTLDVGHCLQNEEDPAAAFTARAGRVRNIHLHDGQLGGASHQALGTGDLDLDAFVDALAQHDYRGFLTIETLSPEALRQSLELLAEKGILGPRQALPEAA